WKRTRKRPPTRASVSAISTGPSSGPHQHEIPSGVVSASNTIEGRAATRRTRGRLVTGRAPALGAPGGDLPSLRRGFFGFCHGLFRLRVGSEPIESCRPEPLIAAEPHHSLPHGLRAQSHGHRAAGLRAGNEPSLIQNVEMLHDCRQLDREGTRELADRRSARALEPREDRAPPRILQRRESAPQPGLIVRHHGKYSMYRPPLSSDSETLTGWESTPDSSPIGEVSGSRAYEGHTC